MTAFTRGVRGDGPACSRNTGADVLHLRFDLDNLEDEGYPWLEWDSSARATEFDAFDPDLLFKGGSPVLFALWRTACVVPGFLLGNDLFFDETVKFGEDQVLALLPSTLDRKNGP
ncbi:MAG: hypothetical protein ACLTSX_01310 [Collinsella sp.]